MIKEEAEDKEEGATAEVTCNKRYPTKKMMGKRERKELIAGRITQTLQNSAVTISWKRQISGDIWKCYSVTILSGKIFTPTAHLLVSTLMFEKFPARFPNSSFST